jgi:proteasome alpha subunit
MYEEPYRWIEAVGNRRHYLDEQFKQGSPLVGLSYAEGILLLTVSRGTPKLYEIYDRIGLGGMGHPADLEKLRFALLETAHLEGFNRSPSDVSAARLMKYVLAPAVKQAFEEIYKAPFIAKILLADLSLQGRRDGRPTDAFLSIDYDGSFEETTGFAVLAATPAIQADMATSLKASSDIGAMSFDQAVDLALRTWALGSLAQTREAREEAKPEGFPEESAAHLRTALADKSIECAVLERETPGPSKYRQVKPSELDHLLASYR